MMMDALAGALPVEMGEDGLTRMSTEGLRQAGTLTLSAEGTTAGAIYAAFHIAAALARRERTRKGCYIDVSSSDAVIATAWLAPALQLNNPDRLAVFYSQEKAPGVARYQWYQTSDRKFVLFCPMETKFWVSFCKLVERPDLVDRLHGVDLRHELQKIFSTRDLQSWMAFAMKHRLPIGPAHRDIKEVEADPHIRSRGVLSRAQHPHRGTITYVGQPAIVDGERVEVPPPSPTLGRDTTEVLTDLGFTPAELEDLRNEGVTHAEVDLHAHIPDIYGGQGA
jgi:crotonobetainyl-CoA:carnitine CoA-transferase CaiB-like acyl-CoA transferase